MSTGQDQGSFISNIRMLPHVSFPAEVEVWSAVNDYLASTRLSAYQVLFITLHAQHLHLVTLDAAGGHVGPPYLPHLGHHQLVTPNPLLDEFSPIPVHPLQASKVIDSDLLEYGQ